jgi:hypothetical protein
MSDSSTEPTDPTTDPVPTPEPETIAQSFETTVSAYGAALKDTLATLETVAAQAPGVLTTLETDVQDLVTGTKGKISSFVASISADIASLIASGV